MKIKSIFLALFFLSVFASLKAQPPCGTNPAAGNYCSTATPICNLNGYCGNTSGTYDATVSASNTADENSSPLGGIFCGSIENNSWLSFVAGATSATFDLWPSNCSDGYGIQMEVYTSNDCYNYTSVSNCYNPATVTNGSVTANGLVVGQTYYIMIDGNAGDICDYIIGAASGVATTPAITGPQSICPGMTANIDVTNGGTGFTWSANPADPTLAGQTTQASISVQPTQTTTYTCVVAGSNPNPLCPGGANLTSVVTVLSASDPLCNSNPGCSIDAVSNVTSVCPGQPVTLSAAGSIENVLLANTFDNSTVGVGWAATSTATFSNPCGVSPPYGTNYLWMGDAAAAPRNLTSLDFNVTNGGTISFWLRFSIQSAASPCEGPDEESEGVSLQYSTNGGGTWADIGYFNPIGVIQATNPMISGTGASGATAFTTWARYSFPIPAAAQTVSSRFRWIQLASTAFDYDHWGLDSIMIVTPPPAQTITWTSVPVGLNFVGTNPPLQYPTVNTCYTATVSDGTNTCSDEVCVTINSITANAGTDATICPNSSTQLLASGGTSYAWSGANLTGANTATPTASPTITTTYTVTVTDANGCSDTDDVTITLNNNLSTTMTFTDPACGNSTGTATCTVNGGQAPFSYTWNTVPVQTTQTATGLPAGTYLVTATDAGGCSATNTVTLTNLSGPNVQISTFTNPDCGSSNGSATCTATGGTLPYSYSWNTVPVQTTQTATGIPSGTYIVTVTATGGCTATNTVTLTDLAGPTVQINTFTNENCNRSNGSATCTPSGGLLPYTFSWSSNPVQSTQTATGLPAGTYTVTVTATGGCTATSSVTITNIPGPTAQISNFTDENCGRSNGTITCSLNGGVAPFTYQWNTTPVQSSQTATGLPAGTYTVTATDANSCTATATGTIANIPGPTAQITIFTNENCGHSNGSATVTVNGGVAPISYAWNSFPTQNTVTANNLPSGNYTVTVTDVNSCTATATVTISNLPGPSASITNIINETCTSGNGGATVTASNGNGPYTYHWNSLPPQYTPDMQNVHAGVYSITVTDANQCTAVNSVTITDTPPPTAIITNVIPEDCGFSNGSATAVPNGGLGPYTYVWNTVPQQGTATAIGLPGGSYTVTITDANTCSVTATTTINIINGPIASAIGDPEYCDRSNGTLSASATGGSGVYTYTWSTQPTQYTQNVSGVPGGTYTVTVDDGGCSSSASVTIMNIPGPTAGFSMQPHVQTFMDGPVSFLDNSSGNINQWNWSLGDGSTQTLTEFDHSYEGMGTYIITLIVTDDNGCKDTVSDTLIIKDIFTIYIPTAFTPNGDSYNEYFYPQGVSIDPNDYEMSIFDRWGNLMYNTTSWADGKWNGTQNNSGTYKDVIMDVYVYRIKVKELNGPKHEYVGRISLIP